MNGILFKPDMIQAIIDGRKTQTRRLYGLKEINKEPDAWQLIPWSYPLTVKMARYGGLFRGADGKQIVVKPRYQVGQTYYIKEAWFVGRQYDALSPSGLFHHPPVGYMSPFTEIAEQEYGRVRSPLHLPAWAARYFIKITAVRYERLSSMSEADAVAEGVAVGNKAYWGCLSDTPFKFAYAKLWDSINPDYPWQSNPWVVAYSFVKTEKPI